jgi:transketolase
VFCGDGDMMKGVPGEAWPLAGHLWMDLIRVGIDEEEVGEQLEGVDKFATSYLKVLDIVEARRAKAGG